MNRNFRELLEAKWAEGRFVCVGLDSDLSKIPATARKQAYAAKAFGDGDVIATFNQAIIDATRDLVCAYKPNLAFYLNHGTEGLSALIMTIEHIRATAPEVPIILDAKVGDIGNTNEGYASFAFDRLGADAITVHPYLGAEAMKPFLDRKDKGVIVLCRTSNPGAGEFQDRGVHIDDPGRIPFYAYVAARVATTWNKNGNCAIVVGATYPNELAEVRQIVGEMPILIPGIGAQGGDLEAAVKAGCDLRGRGMIINSSRGIIFASKGEDFAEAARRETQKLHDQITACLPTP